MTVVSSPDCPVLIGQLPLEGLDFVVDPLGQTAHFEYDTYNQIVATVDESGHRREMTYDVAARPTSARPDCVRCWPIG